MVIAFAITLVLLTGLTVMQKQTGNDDSDKPAARPTPSREADLEKPGETQEEEVRGMLDALDDLREQTAALADEHQIVLTIHDDPPLDIWRVENSVCVTEGEPPPSLEISRNDGTQVQASSDVPPQAELLEDGSCEATTTLAVEDETTYYLSIRLAGRDDPKSTAVVREGSSQEVTLFR